MNPGYILAISPGRSEVFKEYVSGLGSFAEPVPQFSFSRNNPYIVLLVTTSGFISHVGFGRGGISAGSDMRKLKVENITRLYRAVFFHDILETCKKNILPQVQKSLVAGGPVPPKSFEEIIRCMITIDPGNEAVLSKFLFREQSYRKWEPRVIESLSWQKEAISTAMQITDLDRTALQSWKADQNIAPGNFLDGLDQAYLREDTMINSDLTILPGFELIRPASFSRAQFRSPGSGILLDIIVANRTRIEEQTGADLVYYNETYRSFVFVQYKAMEKQGGGAVFRLPDEQLQKEIKSMDALSRKVGEKIISGHAHYRLTYNPFFIKLCPRVIFDPQDIKLTPGMYFSLDHWKILEADGRKTVTFENTGRHITNTDFATLVKQAWVGTTPNQSIFIENLITEIFRTGKSLVYAVKRDTSLVKFKPPEVNNEVSNEEDLPF
jgi:hypothetical protein